MQNSHIDNNRGTLHYPAAGPTAPTLGAGLRAGRSVTRVYIFLIIGIHGRNYAFFYPELQGIGGLGNCRLH